MDVAVSAPAVFQGLTAQLAAFQSLLLLASGLHKMLKSERIGAVVREFVEMPGSLAPTAVMAAAAGELLAGILLWIPSLRAAAAALAVLIWGGYLILILRAIAQGKRMVDCGCSFGSLHRPLGAYQVVRNAALTFSALLVAASAAPGASGGVSGSQLLAAVALLALYVALDQVMALQPPRAGEML